MLLRKFHVLDRLTKDIILIFLGTSLVNAFNLIYQLFLVRKLVPEDFAAFNSLLSIALLLCAPAITLVPTIAKYSAKFNTHNQHDKILLLISRFSKWVGILGIILFVAICLSNAYLSRLLKITSTLPGFIIALVVLFSWLTTVYAGAIQGLEKFGWMMSASVITGLLKLLLGILFVMLGWRIAGALGAYFISSLICFIIYLLPLRDYIFKKARGTLIEFREIVRYILPVAITSFCLTNLISFDMVLVKYYFSATDAGFYSVAQIIGKVFLFLPGAISIAMFPKTAGLNARQQDTTSALKKSLIYGAILCIAGIIVYNLFPSLVLRMLTGKIFPISVGLGRLFSISMSFYALIFILLSYHLSISDFRFIKSLVLFTIVQVLAIAIFHQNIFYVQIILCLNAIILFLINLRLGLIEVKVHS